MSYPFKEKANDEVLVVVDPYEWFVSASDKQIKHSKVGDK